MRPTYGLNLSPPFPRHLLHPFAFARAPIGRRLAELAVPVSFIYGEQDWMSPDHGVAACASARNARQSVTSPNPKWDADGRLSKSDLTVTVVPAEPATKGSGEGGRGAVSGHFVFLDQAAAFDRALDEEHAGPYVSGVKGRRRPSSPV